MRIATWNIGSSVHRVDFTKVRETIRRIDADIWLLQEVDRLTSRFNVNQPLVLKNDLGFSAAFGESLEHMGGHIGNLILSRWPILEWWNYKYPIRKLRPSMPALTNAVVWARIAHPERPLHAICVHYSLGGGPPVAEKNYANLVTDAKMVVSILQSRCPSLDSVILGGDFNQAGPDIVANPEFPESEDVNVTHGQIEHAFMEPDEIDHVWVSNAANGRPGFRGFNCVIDPQSFQVTHEHAVVFYDVRREGPAEPAGCSDRRTQRAQILRDIDKLQRSKPHRQGMDFEEWREAVARIDAKIKAKRSTLERYDADALGAGCEPLVLQPSNAPWNG